MMKAYIKFADTLSTYQWVKLSAWCIVILMGGTVYEVDNGLWL